MTVVHRTTVYIAKNSNVTWLVPKHQNQNPDLAAMCCDGQDMPDSAFDDILFQLRFSLGLVYTAKLNYCWNIWLKIVTEATVVDGNMTVCAFHLAPVKATAGTEEARQLVLEDVAQLRLKKQGHLCLCIIKGHLFYCAICILPQPVNHL